MFSSPIDNFPQLNGKAAQEQNKGSSLVCDYGNSRMRSSSFRDEEQKTRDGTMHVEEP